MSKNHLIDELKEKIRFFLSFGPKIGLVPKASKFREKGISAFIRARNEEYWIRPCILSIKDYVEEILVIDNGSTDSTLDEVKKICNEISTPVRIFSLPEADHCEVSNVGIRESRYNWLLKWDADFIAQTAGPGDFAKLRDYVLGLDQDRYHMIFMNLVNLAGDLWHQPKEGSMFIGEKGPLHQEAYLWNYSPHLRYIWKDYKDYSKVESLLFPPYYRFIEWLEFSVFHVGGIRSIQRLLFDYFWDFGKKQFAEGHLPPEREKVCWEMAEGYFHMEDREKILQNFFNLISKELVRYREDLYGPYSSILFSYLRNPHYRLIYNEKGEIVGRNPDCTWFI